MLSRQGFLHATLRTGPEVIGVGASLRMVAALVSSRQSMISLPSPSITATEIMALMDVHADILFLTHRRSLSLGWRCEQLRPTQRWAFYHPPASTQNCPRLLAFARMPNYYTKGAVKGEFLRTELLVGITAVNIAQTAKDGARRNRNWRNAQEAYKAGLGFLPKLTRSSGRSTRCNPTWPPLNQKLRECRAEESEGHSR